MSGPTTSASATIAALLERGHDPRPIMDTGRPAELSREPVAAVFNEVASRGPIGFMPRDLDTYRMLALHSLAETIAHAHGRSVASILALLDTVPGAYLPFLDDHAGWLLLADMIADRLGILEAGLPLLPCTTN